MPKGQNNARFFQEMVQRYLDTVRDMIEVQTLTQREVVKRLGIPRKTLERMCSRFQLKTQRTGPRGGAGHPDWKGGRTLVGNYWYIYKPDHPYCTKNRRVAEHRLVMEQKLGRYLLPSEVVHHIDGNPQNNHPDNLQQFQTNGEHLAHELKGKCPKWTPEGKARILTAIHRPRPSQKKSRAGGDPQPQPTDHQPSSADSTPSDPSETEPKS